MLSKTSAHSTKVLSHTVKMSFLLVSTLVRVNTEDHLQQSRWKTLIRLLIVTAIASILAGLIVIIHKLHHEINKGFIHFTSTQYLKVCYTEKFYAFALPFCIIAIFIPLHKFILYPTLQRCFSSVKIYQKCFWA